MTENQVRPALNPKDVRPALNKNRRHLTLTQGASSQRTRVGVARQDDSGYTCREYIATAASVARVRRTFFSVSSELPITVSCHTNFLSAFISVPRKKEIEWTP